MSKIKGKLLHKAHRVWQYIVSFLKWVFIALFTGAIGGAVGGAFRFCVDYATKLRQANEFLIYFLPLGGLLIVLLYKISKLSDDADTNLIIKSIRSDEKVPITLAPVIFLSTIITHIFGGSAGREGAAIQLGGCIGEQIGDLFKLDEKDMHICVLCGMSGLFSALFGTPLTATIFAMEVISVGIFYYSAFVPCIVSSIVSFSITRLMGLKPILYKLSNVPDIEMWSVIKVAIIGIACAVVGILFCLALRFTHKYSKKLLKNDFLRIAVGGVLIVLLTLLLGTRYNGIGSNVIHSAFEYGDIYWYDPLLKILFTAITIGFGFKGGEIIPTLFIGATLGYVAGSFLGLDPAFAAAVGMVALFCAVVNCPMASLALSVELFSGGSIVLFAVALAISFMLSGYYGLYSGQKIVYSKRRARFVDRNAK
ncbi:MAG: chloride channel protein [Ruminococcaceae bacterium]|nr:chloride channel protein [Oscillospiraceae bacterium]